MRFAQQEVALLPRLSLKGQRNQNYQHDNLKYFDFGIWNLEKTFGGTELEDGVK